MNQDQSSFLSHTPGNFGRVGHLRSHLEDVSRRALKYAEALDAGEEAQIAALLHDLGKYGDLFQKRLLGKERGIDHWSVGACEALRRYGSQGVAAAVAVQGHHIGLQSADRDSLGDLNEAKLSKNHRSGLRLSETNLTELLGRLENDGLSLPENIRRSTYDFQNSSKMSAAAMLDVRMLFSALVDADFIETEAHFNARPDGSKGYRESGPPLKAKKALDILISYLDKLAEDSRSSDNIMKMRLRLLEACINAGSQSPALFTLTAPTGSGKTLSMLAFALRHAVDNHLRRIVVVAPYLSIIGQAARVYRQIFERHFGEDYVLEHHSLSGTRGDDMDSLDDMDFRESLLAENWDAPIIVTTSVQILESLFANRSSACRKLHRLAKSVILFDEVQTIPVQIAIPTLATLSHLVARYGSSVVFSTATQPAFGHLNKHVKKFCVSGWNPREIIPADLRLFKLAKRTEVKWSNLNCSLGWPELAEQLSKLHQTLCIVNLKRHALLLFDMIQSRNCSGLFHMSTNMCPVHRMAVLEKVRVSLKEGRHCRLVSTQCVEAGVDLDFPIVYRVLGPLDAIAQAAGRCNREGRLKSGRVVVFLPEEDGGSPYPDGAYKQATAVTRIILQKYDVNNLDIMNPESYEEYYCELYSVSRPENLNEELTKAIKMQNFVEVAKKYHVIEKRGSIINVLVPYNDNIFNQLKSSAECEGLTRKWIAEARPYSISMYRPRDDSPMQNYLLPITVRRRRENSDDWFIYLESKHYDKDKGLVLPSEKCLIA